MVLLYCVDLVMIYVNVDVCDCWLFAFDFAILLARFVVC